MNTHCIACDIAFGTLVISFFSSWHLLFPKKFSPRAFQYLVVVFLTFFGFYFHKVYCHKMSAYRMALSPLKTVNHSICQGVF